MYFVQNAPKALWKSLKNLGMRTKVKCSSPIGLNNNNDKISFESKFVADTFNSFFCNIAKKLVEKLPNRQFNERNIFDFYQEQNLSLNTFKFTIVADKDIEKLRKSLNISKSTGCDNISATFLRDGAEVLTYIINLSLKTSSIPVDFKTARVFKKG